MKDYRIRGLRTRGRLMKDYRIGGRRTEIVESEVVGPEVA